ncbi:MAG: hypothetical protein QF632_06830 [Candidatus Woesearchaeota archaeon]|jgi:hypothetical protein|nr:hypothetical protein [Candidatus Woesearchaeota archaeon]MDP7457120.1 hypothetical protein [Candidatus Woesearchaeota archaeon]
MYNRESELPYFQTAVVLEHDWNTLNRMGKVFEQLGIDYFIARTCEYYINLSEKIRPHILVTDRLGDDDDKYAIIHHLKKSDSHPWSMFCRFKAEPNDNFFDMRIERPLSQISFEAHLRASNAKLRMRSAPLPGTYQ